MGIRSAAPPVILVLALAGCSTSAEPTQSDNPTTLETQPLPSSESQIYSAVLEHLYTSDQPFGDDPSLVNYIYVLDAVASRSSEIVIEADGAKFGDSLEDEIAAQSDGLPPVEFIANRDERVDLERQGATGVVNDGIIVGLANPEHRADGTVEVGAGYWCGFDCGFGATYVLESIDGHWRVTGKTGPIAFS